MLEEQEQDDYGNDRPESKKRRLLPAMKHATPGSNPSSSTDAAIAHAEPMSCSLDASAATSSSVNEIRQTIYGKFAPEDVRVGDLHTKTDDVFQEQWCGKFFSYALLVVIPRMVSGPDLPWRPRFRRSEQHAGVNFTTFLQGFAKRVENQCRSDFTALPIIRSVWYRFMAQERSFAGDAFRVRRNGTQEESATEHVIAMRRQA